MVRIHVRPPTAQRRGGGERGLRSGVKAASRMPAGSLAARTRSESLEEERRTAGASCSRRPRIRASSRRAPCAAVIEDRRAKTGRMSRGVIRFPAGTVPWPGRLRAISGVQAVRARAGCLGGGRRRRTRQAAISSGETHAVFDPEISEWGNPASHRMPPPRESIARRARDPAK